MFRRLETAAVPVTVVLDGRPVPGQAGETIADLLLRETPPQAGVNPVSQATRAPYCMMGICFECLVEIDDGTTVQACLTPLREGLRITRRTALPELLS